MLRETIYSPQLGFTHLPTEAAPPRSQELCGMKARCSLSPQCPRLEEESSRKTAPEEWLHCMSKHTQIFRSAQPRGRALGSANSSTDGFCQGFCSVCIPTGTLMAFWLGCLQVFRKGREIRNNLFGLVHIDIQDGATQAKRDCRCKQQIVPQLGGTF